jgi:lipopolysaccharide/colanic/teichoic acid biosynthesis glycosyltransferase
VAQAAGRNALPWDVRLELDAAYAEAPSLARDLRAMAGTLGILLRGIGVHAPGHATMPVLGKGKFNPWEK